MEIEEQQKLELLTMMVRITLTMQFLANITGVNNIMWTKCSLIENEYL